MRVRSSKMVSPSYTKISSNTEAYFVGFGQKWFFGFLYDLRACRLCFIFRRYLTCRINFYHPCISDGVECRSSHPYKDNFECRNARKENFMQCRHAIIRASRKVSLTFMAGVYMIQKACKSISRFAIQFLDNGSLICQVYDTNENTVYRCKL